MIWIDVDCVLADIFAFVEKAEGIKLPNNFGYDLDAVVTSLTGKHWTWRNIPWAELPPTPWAFELITLVQQSQQTIPSQQTGIGFLTACVHQDRAQWLDWFKKVTHTTFAPCVFTGQKHYVVRAGDTILDDYPVVTDGKLIRVPAQWWLDSWPQDQTEQTKLVLGYIRSKL